THPDRNPNDEGALARFKAINTAYQILSNPESRARYDRYAQEGYGLDALRGYRTPTGPPPAPSSRPRYSTPAPPGSDPGSDPWISPPISSAPGAPRGRMGTVLAVAVGAIAIGGIVTVVVLLRAEGKGAAASAAAATAPSSAAA